MDIVPYSAINIKKSNLLSPLVNNVGHNILAITMVIVTEIGLVLGML